MGSKLGSACTLGNPTDTSNLTYTDSALTPGVSNDNHDSFDLLERVQRDEHNANGSRMIAPHLAAPSTIAHSCDRCKKAKKKCSGPNWSTAAFVTGVMNLPHFGRNKDGRNAARGTLWNSLMRVIVHIIIPSLSKRVYFVVGNIGPIQYSISLSQFVLRASS